jgi:hypothetical protein
MESITLIDPAREHIPQSSPRRNLLGEFKRKSALSVGGLQGVIPSLSFWRPFAPCFASTLLVRPVYVLRRTERSDSTISRASTGQFASLVQGLSDESMSADTSRHSSDQVTVKDVLNNSFICHREMDCRAWYLPCSEDNRCCSSSLSRECPSVQILDPLAIRPKAAFQ